LLLQFENLTEKAASNLAFCSSIFFAKLQVAGLRYFLVRHGLSAEAVQSAKELIAQKIPDYFISAKFATGTFIYKRVRR